MMTSSEMDFPSGLDTFQSEKAQQAPQRIRPRQSSLQRTRDVTGVLREQHALMCRDKSAAQTTQSQIVAKHEMEKKITQTDSRRHSNTSQREKLKTQL